MYPILAIDYGEKNFGLKTRVIIRQRLTRELFMTVDNINVDDTVKGSRP